MVQELDQPFLANLVEERSDIGVENVVHPRAGDADHQSIQRIVLAALSRLLKKPLIRRGCIGFDSSSD
jgi:hypothetical protein